MTIPYDSDISLANDHSYQKYHKILKIKMRLQNDDLRILQF